jgi:uncharacterized protein (DUF488 family)
MIAKVYPVLTVGHSNHPLELFLALLQRHDVNALADIRSMPYSRFAPKFNKESLESTTREWGVKYVFLGRQLGGRSEDPSCYINRRVQYPRLARTEIFSQGIARVIRGASDYRLALMCAEKDPLDCHRTLLVSPALVERGMVVEHILADGELESHDDAMERLLDRVGLSHEDLFRSRAELIAEALAKQEEKIAYTSETFSSDATDNSHWGNVEIEHLG